MTRAGTCVVLVCAVVVSVALAPPAHAGEVTVSTTPELEAAVAAAHDGDVIKIAPGTYLPKATLDIRGNITVEGLTSSSSPPGVRISGSNITQTTPPDVFAVEGGAALTLRNVAITTTKNVGHVVNILDGASATLEQLAISANNGVAILVEVAALTLRNSTISDNADAGVVSAGADVQIFNSTITNNRLRGISNEGGGSLRLTNTIVADNPGGDCAVAADTSVASLDADGSCGANIHADPKLGPLTLSNGGPTPTRALLPGSPAIDAGTNTLCPAVDQRLLPRDDGHCDIGAYELVQVADTTPPVITVPANINAEATGPGGAVVPYTVTFTDPGGAIASSGCVPPPASTFPLGTTTVTCSAADLAGNTASASFTVSVVDTTPPVLSGLPAGIIVGATSPAGAVVSYPTPAAVDAVDGPVSVSCAPPSGSTFAVGTTPVECSASDAHGNRAAGSFSVTVTIGGTAPPVISVPADLTVEATGPSGALVPYTVTVTDPDDAVASSSCAPAPATTFPLGTTTVQCTATDEHGHTSARSFTVTVVDTSPPSIATPAGITVASSNPAGTPVTYASSAQDLVDGERPVACVPASGAVFPIGTTTVACSSSDTRGNARTTRFPVTVNLVVQVRDETPPVITVADVAVEATGPSGAQVPYSVTFSDPDDFVAASACTPASASTFPIGATTVTCSATDEHANTATATFTVTVKDTTYPAIEHLPSDIAAPAITDDGAVVMYNAPAADDIVDGSVPVACSPASGSLFAVGATGVVCRAVDARGNTALAGFTVTVTPLRDTTFPVVRVPRTVRVRTASKKGVRVRYIVRVSDPDDEIADFWCDTPTGSLFPIGLTRVMCVATDAHANTTIAHFEVSVVYAPKPRRDRTGPAIDAPRTVTAWATSPVGAIVRYSVRAGDAGGVRRIVCTPRSGSLFRIGWTTVTCVAWDRAGNRSRSRFGVHVVPRR